MPSKQTVGEFLEQFNACERAQKKYKHTTDFKNAWINCHWQDASWITYSLFYATLSVDYQNLFYAKLGVDYPNLPIERKSFYSSYCRIGRVDSLFLAGLFHKKANRIKYWPEVRKRLSELGVNTAE